MIRADFFVKTIALSRKKRYNNGIENQNKTGKDDAAA
jgi:hypothetical protein